MLTIVDKFNNVVYIYYVVYIYHKGRCFVITFGGFVKSLRMRNSFTLREFCRVTNMDPSNWSKIERGIFPPPKSNQVLQEIAKVLNLQKNSEDFNTLFDLAAISYIPPELLNDQRIVEKLPVFFRTMRGERPTRKELEELIKILKEE